MLLGLALRHGSTPVDDWFQGYRHSPIRWLKFFMDPRLVAVVLVLCVAVDVSQRRWQLATAAVVGPTIGVILAQLFKPLIGRPMEGVLAYPSGHATFTATVLGMAVLTAGCAMWAVGIAVTWCLLGMVGVGASFHYFTDTVGGVLLGTAIVCGAALISGREPHRT